MSSTPESTLAAARNDLKPGIGLVTRLTARWSCSTMLLRYYISTAINPNQRVAVVRAHYEFIFRRGLRQLVTRASIGPERLGQTRGRSGMLYHILLRTMDEFDREGELVLQLSQEDSVLCSIVFTVAPRGGRPSASAASKAVSRTMHAKRFGAPLASCTGYGRKN